MKLALVLLATLACIGWSAGESSVEQMQGDEAYYPPLHAVVQGGNQGRTWQRTRPYRRRVVDEQEQKPRRVYDYGMYESGQTGGSQPNRIQLRDGRYVQYGNQQRWAVWPRTREQTRYSPTSQWREQTTTTTPAPTRIPPRLLLRSGDNVHFGEGINWSIYKTDSGITRVGTRDGEVVVRVVRPNYEPPTTTTPRPRPTTERPRATTPYQWTWQPCHTEQECYRQYVNEYYRFYANNQG